MIDSAFGVPHMVCTTTVSKTYVPGKGYLSLSELSRKERSAARLHIGTNKVERRHHVATKEQRAPSATGRKIWRGFTTPKGKLTHVIPRAGSDMKHQLNPELQGFSRPNGRGGGYVKVYRRGENPELTLKHEMAHIKPRRNIHTFQERYKVPRKAGGEEGRADYIANGKRTPGRYPGNPAFQYGYNSVQRKMHAAHVKAGKVQPEKKRTYTLSRKQLTMADVKQRMQARANNAGS